MAQVIMMSIPDSNYGTWHKQSRWPFLTAIMAHGTSNHDGYS